MNEREKSKAAYAAALGVIPGGVDSPVRALKAVGTHPLFVRRAEGPYLYDIDGNRFIDFCMSWGVFILGHNAPAVTSSAVAAVQAGSSYGTPTLAETELAERIRQHLPTMERLRFVNSGTEATMSAIRVARGFTGRDTLVKFEGCYHGHADHLLVAAGSAAANLPQASSAGVPADFVKHTVVLPYNDAAAVRHYFAAHGAEVAAVIVEPVACNMGVVPPKAGFLETLREVTTASGALLIFDEVITAFRVASGGAQARFGIRPDLTTVGKIVGGGFPAAAFGGRADIMGLLAPEGPVYQAGTLSGNPVAMAAGLATLTGVEQEGFYEELERRSARFAAELEKITAGRGITVNRVGSMFTLFFHPGPVEDFRATQAADRERFGRYFRRMLQRGVYVSPSQFEGNFISACHTDDILDYVLESIARALEDNDD